jgi:hypothetical protein
MNKQAPNYKNQRTNKFQNTKYKEAPKNKREISKHKVLNKLNEL